MNIQQNFSNILIGFLLVVVALFAGFVFLTKAEYLYVGISPYAHYKLNDKEAEIINEWINKFHENVEKGNLEFVKEESLNKIADVDWKALNASKAKFAFDKYGKINRIDFFNSLPPDVASELYGNHITGNAYRLTYHTSAERGMLSENFELVITKNNDVKLLSYHGDEMQEWEKIERNNKFWLEHNLKNEIRIPFGNRFIVIRY